MPDSCHTKFTGAACLADDRFDARCSDALDPLATCESTDLTPSIGHLRASAGFADGSCYYDASTGGEDLICVFTKALLGGMREEWLADPFKVGAVTYKGLDHWLSARLPVLSNRWPTPRLLAAPGGVDYFELVTR